MLFMSFRFRSSPGRSPATAAWRVKSASQVADDVSELLTEQLQQVYWELIGLAAQLGRRMEGLGEAGGLAATRKGCRWLSLH